MCVSVGQDPPVVTVQSVSATVTPRLTTASINDAIITHAVARTARPPAALPQSQSMSTKKPPGQPSVTGAKEAGATSPRLTTLSTETTAPPRPGRLYSRDVFWMFYCSMILHTTVDDE